LKIRRAFPGRGSETLAQQQDCLGPWLTPS
jgi:hypothetical protein